MCNLGFGSVMLFNRKKGDLIMTNCTSCGISLYALNMGFVDDSVCQLCEVIKIEILSRDIFEGKP